MPRCIRSDMDHPHYEGVSNMDLVNRRTDFIRVNTDLVRRGTDLVRGCTNLVLVGTDSRTLGQSPGPMRAKKRLD